MNSLRSFVLAVIVLVPVSGFAQGVRMSADFFPLAVGNRWVYDIVNQDGRKLSEVDFSVSEHTIVKGRSYYVISRFPFAIPSGSEIHLLRYDKGEKQFLRVLDDQEGSLFLSEGATVEVLEADKNGLPVKFVLQTPTLDLTFQRGIGIVEARLQGGNGVQIAKIASARVGEGVGPRVTTSARNPNANPNPNPGASPAPVPGKAPTAAQQAGIPEPKSPEQKRKQVDNVGAISEDNPLLILDVVEVADGHKFVLTVKNISDKLLPFTFSSGQSYDFAVIDSATGQEIWRWSRHMFFVTQVRRTEAIPPQGQWKFEITWNHRDNNLDRVPAGSYEVVGFVAVQPALESETIKIEVK